MTTSGTHVDVHAIEVWLGPGRGDSWDIECEATITGDFELTLTGSRSEPVLVGAALEGSRSEPVVSTPPSGGLAKTTGCEHRTLRRPLDHNLFCADPLQGSRRGNRF